LRSVLAKLIYINPKLLCVNHMYKVILEVIQVPEKCAADYKVGDKIVIEDPKIVLKESTNVCLYALSALIPYLIPLTRELPKDDWMNQITELSCSDPHNSVKFKVTRIKTTP
jgi:uncharacterized repeat protein (TIGR04076 family)